MASGVLEQIKGLSGVVVIVLTILGSALFGMSRYNDLDGELDDYRGAQHMKELREENRLTTIEEQLKATNDKLEQTNKLLEKILERLD